MSKPRLFKVYNTEESPKKVVHEYNIIQEMNKNGHLVTTLSRSYDDVWAEDRRGENVISLIDTGNEMIFPKKEFAGDVGYDRFAELYILLAFLNRTETYFLYKGYIEEVVPAKIFEI